MTVKQGLESISIALLPTAGEAKSGSVNAWGIST